MLTDTASPYTQVTAHWNGASVNVLDDHVYTATNIITSTHPVTHMPYQFSYYNWGTPFNDRYVESSGRSMPQGGAYTEYLASRQYFIIPMYNPDLADEVVALKEAHPSVPFVVIINPSSGPGETEEDLRFDTPVADMRAAGVEWIVGYVPTYYAKSELNPAVGSPWTNIVYDETKVSEYVDHYYDWYDVNGIMFDEVATNSTTLVNDYYDAVTDDARSRAASDTTFSNDLIIGSPGTAIDDTKFAMFDIVVISVTSDNYPSESTIFAATENTGSDASRYAMMLYDVSSFSESDFENYNDHTRGIFITNDGDNEAQTPDYNPWDEWTDYADEIMTEMEEDPVGLTN